MTGTANIPSVSAGSDGPLPPPVAAHAAAKFRDSGVLVLKDLLPPARVEQVLEEYRKDYSGFESGGENDRVKEVGDRRLMISLSLEGIFAEADIFASPIALSIVKELLGEDFILGSYVAVTSYVRSKAQRIHADQQGLFEDDDLNAAVPPYSVTLVIPLVALNDETGSTLFYPGTHLNPGAENPADAAPHLDPGDAILFDSRILHGGLPNRSGQPRPILYCTYHRAWYRDVSNFADMPAMVIDDDMFGSLDAAQQQLVGWALSER